MIGIQTSAKPDEIWQEDPGDRFARRFATVLWEFDDTEFFGEPPPDKGKWLEEVREDVVKLRLSPEVVEVVIEKLKKAPSRGPFDVDPFAEDQGSETE